MWIVAERDEGFVSPAGWLWSYVDGKKGVLSCGVDLLLSSGRACACVV